MCLILPKYFEMRLEKLFLMECSSLYRPIVTNLLFFLRDLVTYYCIPDQINWMFLEKKFFVKYLGILI